mgnify:CR=1 FL=1
MRDFFASLFFGGTCFLCRGGSRGLAAPLMGEDSALPRFWGVSKTYVFLTAQRSPANARDIGSV